MTIMHKSVIAAAVSAACVFPIAVQAQTSVTVYGKMYPSFDHVNVSGGTAAGTPVSTLSASAKGTNATSLNTMDAPNSRLGFRGTEDLGDGLKAIFQLEMGFGLDTGGGKAGDPIFSRNTFLGLQGKFGTVKLGNMDTVYKELGDHMTFLGVTSGNFMGLSNILSKAGFGTSSASSFHLRRANSFYYESPEFAGVQGLFDWSPNETAGDASSGVISTGVKYESGPVYLALAYETHKDMFGASLNVPSGIANTTGGVANPGASSRDSAVRATAQYRFPNNYRAEVNVAQLRYNESGGAIGKFDSYKHNTWSISAEKIIGAVSLVASYGQSQAGSCSLVGGVACTTSGLNARMFNIGSSYALSKRTSLFAVYSYMGNDTSAVQSNWLNGKPSAGQDISTLGVGISHSF
ncbi:porin [Oxalobacteraceae bacterium CAVE-383]|nr:porin [Oxalobacteraceae bacterium CAVE-383]